MLPPTKKEGSAKDLAAAVACARAFCAKIVDAAQWRSRSLSVPRLAQDLSMNLGVENPVPLVDFVCLCEPSPHFFH